MLSLSNQVSVASMTLDYHACGHGDRASAQQIYWLLGPSSYEGVPDTRAKASTPHPPQMEQNFLHRPAGHEAYVKLLEGDQSRNVSSSRQYLRKRVKRTPILDRYALGTAQAFSDVQETAGAAYEVTNDTQDPLAAEDEQRGID
ncbi:hypothetical protein PVAG01_08191 [Phlyctema vagabunda]|uniref:Uncharacterized protein n=1 Tax=Phlyctema vagabunda TaxID=108571 RepID=A0ABR4P8R1_9HELO